ncbi:unnamed protein product [Acanthoscelides obtectus]|uniref:Uncharacterized protein n=1 Tax=Acanthoscelides obtectus TaxID=200917 RepID=A0A9P0JHR4_ACAOB|nr:unnamed protein product [Acanthoscelides obtectus]CAK1639910.1 hypothetical protein AOBTE_LOCUS11444 [Acanthoscelides obtectus]
MERVLVALGLILPSFLCTPRKSDPRLRHKANSGVRGDVLHFTFGEGITKFHVSNATLFVFLRGTDRRPLPDVNVEVFKVFEANLLID